MQDVMNIWTHMRQTGYMGISRDRYTLQIAGQKQQIPGTSFDMIFYADDTIVVSKSLEAVEELLNVEEILSGGYGQN